MSTATKPANPGIIRTCVRTFRAYAANSRDTAGTTFRRVMGREVWIRPQLKLRTATLGTGDGKWCISPAGLGANSVVYSVGVGNDISFDLALIDQFGLQVFGFDPTPVCAGWIKQQVYPKNFTFVPMGLGTTDGTAGFALPAGHNISFSMVSGTHRPGDRVVEAPIRRLSTLMQELGHKRIHILKLDIEGAEYDVLSDILEQAAHIDQLLVEFHHRLMGVDGVTRTRDAVTRICAHGFKLFHVSPRALEYSFIRDGSGTN